MMCKLYGMLKMLGLSLRRHEVFWQALVGSLAAGPRSMTERKRHIFTCSLHIPQQVFHGNMLLCQDDLSMQIIYHMR